VVMSSLWILFVVDSDSIGFCHFLLFVVFSLQNYYKKLLKQLLSLAINVADPAVYMISGLLPLEAEIHTKVFTMDFAIFSYF
jgi:hypothetical protein